MSGEVRLMGKRVAEIKNIKKKKQNKFCMICIEQEQGKPEKRVWKKYH